MLLDGDRLYFAADERPVGSGRPLAVIGTATSAPLALDVVIRNPETGVPIKRFAVDDARFTIPGFSGRVQQKTTVSITWESDEGDLLVHER